MNQARILIVDDEPNVRFVLEHTLKEGGYILDTAEDGGQAINMVSRTNYDLILLDLQMKPVNGLEVLTAVHERKPDTVVIILTAHSTIESAVDALRMGAFDYLFKPASPETIRERVREGLKQRKQDQDRLNLIDQIYDLKQSLLNLDADSDGSTASHLTGRFIRSGKLVIDLYHRTGTLEGRLLDLTTTEFNLLVCLIQNAPHTVLPKQLVSHALEYEVGDAEASEIIKYHIHHLRQKIEPDPSKPRLIRTIRYKGYLWSGE
ncbi:MAG: response regulator transcription factor [Anaerolineaceae bacterium]